MYNTYLCTLRDMYVEVQKDEVVPESSHKSSGQGKHTTMKCGGAPPPAGVCVCVWGGGGQIYLILRLAPLFFTFTRATFVPLKKHQMFNICVRKIGKYGWDRDSVIL